MTLAPDDRPGGWADMRARADAEHEHDDYELHCPSTDVCCWCGDSECDGIGCIASLDPDDVRDHEAIERLHAWLRRGQLLEQLERRLAVAENRSH